LVGVSKGGPRMAPPPERSADEKQQSG
jgi:hypothetical protein